MISQAITPSVHAGATDSSIIETLRAPFGINSDTFRRQQLPHTAALKSGGFAVAWLDSSDPQQDDFGFDIKVQLLAPDGSKLGAPVTANTFTEGSQQLLAITGLAGGGFVVSWWTVSGLGQLSVQIFDAAGAKVGGEFNVHENGALNFRNDPAVAALDDGGFVIAYDARTVTFGQSGSGNHDIQLQRYSATGALIGPEVTINSVTVGRQGRPEIASTSSGGYVVAWQDEVYPDSNFQSPNYVTVRRFGSDGQPLGDQFRVNPNRFEDQTDLKVTGLSGGGFAIVWREGTVIKAQAYDAAGIKTADLLVASDSPVFSGSPAITALPSNQFMVAWVNGAGHSGQIYDASGDAIGNVLTLSADGVFGPSLAATASGQLLATWTTQSSDPNVSTELVGQLLVIEQFGTSGTDKMIGGSGRDVLSGADGDDVIVGAAGGDRLRGGAGSDQIHSHEAQPVVGTTDFLRPAQKISLDTGTESDSLDGGLGDDLLYAGVGDNVSGSDHALYGDKLYISFLGASSGVTADFRRLATETFITIAGGTIAEIEEVASIEGSNFDDFLAAWSSGPAFTVGSSIYARSGNDQLFGGTGNDSLDGGTGADAMTGGVGDDLYFIDDGGDKVIELAGEGIDEIRTSLADTTISANVEKLTYVGTGSAILRGDAAANELRGGAGNDLFRLEQGGRDSAVGGLGGDQFFYGAAFTADDSNDGGAGTDVLILQGNYSVAMGALSLVDVEYLSLQSGSSTRYGEAGTASYDYSIAFVDANVAAGQRFTINASQLLAGETFVFDGSAETAGQFLIYGGYGDDRLTGGSSHDMFHFEGSRWGGGDAVDGGAGADALIIRGGSGLTQITFGDDQVRNIESITVSDRFGLGAAGRPSYDLTLANGNVTPGGTLILNGSTLVDPGQKFDVDGSLVTGGHLKIYGGAGADRLIGGAGNDLLYAAGGQDVLTGGGGADTFQLRSTLDSTLAASDSILDFASGTDRIDLRSVDANIHGAGDQAFQFVGSAAFTQKAGELRAVDMGAGRWNVEGDVNGDGSADFAIQVTLATPQPLAAADFLL